MLNVTLDQTEGSIVYIIQGYSVVLARVYEVRVKAIDRKHAEALELP